MRHPREIIRDRFAALLSTPTDSPAPVFPTAAKRRVYNSRDLPLDAESATPAILIYTLSETLDPVEAMDGGIRRRTMDLAVQIYETGLSREGDPGEMDLGALRVDEIAWTVENLVYADPTFGGLVERCTLKETSIQVAGDAEETALWVAGMAFEVVYVTHMREAEGTTPTQIMLGFDPDTGPGNEPDYYEVFNAPDVGDLP
jgi:hypothetical protein